MITSAVVAFVSSLLVFCILLMIVRGERRRGRRFLLANFRMWLDSRLDVLIGYLSRKYDHFVRYVLQLNWYYSIHSVLRMWLRMIVKLYTYFEDVFENNRTKTKKLRAEKRQIKTITHLQQMADHKVETALTPSQKRRLRHKKLEEKH